MCPARHRVQYVLRTERDEKSHSQCARVTVFYRRGPITAPAAALRGHRRGAMTSFYILAQRSRGRHHARAIKDVVAPTRVYGTSVRVFPPCRRDVFIFRKMDSEGALRAS